MPSRSTRGGQALNTSLQRRCCRADHCITQSNGHLTNREFAATPRGQAFLGLQGAVAVVHLDGVRASQRHQCQVDGPRHARHRGHRVLLQAHVPQGVDDCFFHHCIPCLTNRLQRPAPFSDLLKILVVAFFVYSFWFWCHFQLVRLLVLSPCLV